MLENRTPGLAYYRNRKPLCDRIGREPYSISELSKEIGYSRWYVCQMLNKKVNMPAMCAVILHHYSKGYLDPHKLLEEYGNLERDKAKLEGLLLRYKDNPITKNPMHV